MESKFSLSRVNLLLKRYLIENITNEVLFWSSIILLFTILDNRVFVIAVMFISGFIYSQRLHKEFLRGPNGMHYMMIPATQAEKLVSIVFLNTVYHFIMTLLAYSIGNELVTLVYHYALKIPVPVSWDLFIVSKTVLVDGYIDVIYNNVFWQIFGLFAFSQAIFILGALYFKSNILAKTILSIFVVGGIFFFVQILLFKHIWDIKYISNALLPVIVMVNDATFPAIASKSFVVLCCALLPYLWLVSYFKLTEKEV